MEHILGGCSDFCLGIWVHQHRTCCKHWLHENSWQRINIWGSRDASATVTVAHTETIEVFKHSCKSILCFYKQSELICQHNYYNGDTGERVGHQCLPKVCKRTLTSRGNLLWQFFKPESSESFSLPLAYKTTLASWTKFSLGRNDVCKCSHEASLAGPLSGTERKTLDFFFTGVKNSFPKSCLYSLL